MAGSGSHVFKQDSLTGTAVKIVGHRCHITAVRGFNTTAANAYIQMFDAASTDDVTLGTTIPTWVVTAQDNDTSDGDGLPTDGLIFENGLVAASTTTVVNSTGAVQHARFCIK